MREYADDPDGEPRQFASPACLMHELVPDALEVRSASETRAGAEGASGRDAGCEAPRSELRRIEFLLDRDGLEATREWVGRTRAIYRQALADPTSHAADPTYKPRFERSVREFEEWLAAPTP